LTTSETILVTGGAGFIGSHFVELLIEGTNHPFRKVVVVDSLTYSGLRSNLAYFEKRSNFQFVEADISNKELMLQIVKNYSIDSIVNFAAESHVDRSIQSSMPFVSSNVAGTTNLLEIFRDNCDGRFIQISTDEVYGSIRRGSWSENEPLQPNSPYSASKAGADLMALAFQRTYGLNLCITRCSNNYGARQFPEKVIPLFITNLIEGKKLPLYGDGLNVRDWIHVRDHCQGILKVLMSGEDGEIYNIGGNKEISNLELSRKILKHFGKGEESIEFVADRAGHDFRYSVDDSKIRQKLAFENKIEFEVGLAETIEWYVANSEWWHPLK